MGRSGGGGRIGRGLSRSVQSRLIAAGRANPDFVTDPEQSVSRINAAVRSGQLTFNAKAISTLSDRDIAYQILATGGRLTVRGSYQALSNLGAGLRAGNPQAIAAAQRLANRRRG